MTGCRVKMRNDDVSSVYTCAFLNRGFPYIFCRGTLRFGMTAFRPDYVVV